MSNAWRSSRATFYNFLLLFLLTGGACQVRAADTLQEIKARGVLLWGADAEGGAPYVYPDPQKPEQLIGFEYELDQMRNMGLIRGASLENAVCFDRGTILNPGGLRFPDECCRHKALDLIGDLALVGKPLLGHVIAEKAGHAMHFALVQKIMNDPTLYEILTLDQIEDRMAHALVS